MPIWFITVRVEPRPEFDAEGEDPLSVVRGEINASLDEIGCDADIVAVAQKDEWTNNPS